MGPDVRKFVQTFVASVTGVWGVLLLSQEHNDTRIHLH